MQPLGAAQSCSVTQKNLSKFKNFEAKFENLKTYKKKL